MVMAVNQGISQWILLGYRLMAGIGLLLVFLWLGSAARADEKAVISMDGCDVLLTVCADVSESAPKIDAIPVTEGSIGTLLDASNRLFSEGLNGFSRRIDEFLADEKLFYESSGSFIRLRADSVWFEQDASGFTGSVRLKLNLPRSKDKYKFTFESEPERLDDDLDSDVNNNLIDAADDKVYFAGLQLIASLAENWRYRTGVGIKLRSPVDSYFRLGVSGHYLFYRWSLNLDETLYWFDKAGRSSVSSMELNRRLADDLLFRSSTMARWAEVDDYFKTSQIFSFFKTLGKNRLISFHAGVYGVTKPVHKATDYRMSVNFRRSLRKEYLFLELIPQIRYQKVNGFSSERGFVFRLEWVFQG